MKNVKHLKPTKQWSCLKSMAAKCTTKDHVKALYFLHRPHCHLEEPIQALFSTYWYISLALCLADPRSPKNLDWLHEKSCHMKQTLFSVIFNVVLCIVMSLLLLLLFLHVAILSKLAYLWSVELGDHLLGRRIFVYSLYQYYSDSIVSGVCSH